MDNVSIGAAFVAGIISFLSPCVLPLVPGYISFLSGASLEELEKQDNKNVVYRAGILSVFFVAGFTLIFVALGASATFIGQILSKHFNILSKAAGIVIVLLGLHLTGIFKINALYHQKRINVKNFTPGIWGAFVVGIAFAFGWTPCIGPILSGILALAATKKNMVEGMVLLGVYSLGMGIPFIVTGFAIGIFMKFFERYKKFIRVGEVFAGILLIMIGVLIFTDNLGTLLKYLPEGLFEFAK